MWLGNSVESIEVNLTEPYAVERAVTEGTVSFSP